MIKSARDIRGGEMTDIPGSASDGRHTHRVLLAYATGFGTTRDVAVAIGEVLGQAGASVEVKPIRDVADLENYDAVIIGSPIRYDNWMSEARRFVLAHQDRLGTLPVAFFFTCLTLSQPTEKARQHASTYTNKLSHLCSRVEPISIGGFAGVLDYSKMPPWLRLIARCAMAIFGAKEGDYRDWGLIRAWAEDVRAAMAKIG